MSEYGEPWWPWSDSKDGDYILGADGHTVVSLEGNAISDNDVRRIVACVNALAGIPNPEAVRELIRWAKIWNVTLETDEAHWEAEFQMSEALAALTAPSASPQQK